MLKETETLFDLFAIEELTKPVFSKTTGKYHLQYTTQTMRSELNMWDELPQFTPTYKFS